MALIDPPKEIYLKINNTSQEALLALPNFTQSHFLCVILPNHTVFSVLEASLKEYLKKIKQSTGLNSKTQNSQLEIWLVFFKFDGHIRDSYYILGKALGIGIHIQV